MTRDTRRSTAALLVTLALASTSCKKREPPPSKNSGERVMATDVDGVILPATSTWFLADGKTTAWAPPRAEVLRAEAALPALLGRSVRGMAIKGRLPSYKRQYVGLVRDGQKVVYLNAFCGDEPGWTEHLVSVSDGGDCYFQTEWRVEQGAFAELHVNGSS